jgi:hypothetical protein
MPRRPRSAPEGIAYHARNRANGRATLFRKPQDYEASLQIVDDALVAVPTRLLGYTVMPSARVAGQFTRFRRS